MMSSSNKRVRVLYSFPNKLGAARIRDTAWQQVNGLAAAGADITVYAGGLLRPVLAGVKVHTNSSVGKGAHSVSGDRRQAGTNLA